MNLLVLMGGTRVTESSNPYPLYLTEIRGKIILEIVLEKYLKEQFGNKIFCVRQDDIDSFNVDSIIKSVIPDAEVVVVKGKTQGALCTSLLASEFIDNSEEVLIVSVDDYIDENITNVISSFRDNKADCGIVTFSSVHPRYSFAIKDNDGKICQITEKKPMSKDALTSFYYFNSGNDFINCAKNVIRKDNKINDSFYMSQSINEMILLQKKIALYKINNNQFHSFKTERQLAAYITSYENDKEII